jgi:hypothetical protein
MKAFTDEEIAALVPLAREAVDQTSPWEQLADYFDKPRSDAEGIIEPRPSAATK